MSNLEDLTEWHKAAPEKINKHTKIVTPESFPTPRLYHISKDPKIKKFIPLIGRRQAPTEDRTIPRVTVAPTIIGCMIGYADIESDFMINKELDKSYKVPFLGGWKIYAFDFEAALKPDGHLVFDARSSDEVWLTTYNKATHEYVAKIIGEFFYTTMTYHARDKDPYSTGDLYLKTSLDLPFSNTKILKPGQYLIKGYTGKWVRDGRDDKGYEIQEISESDYMKAKHGVADMLGFHTCLPTFTSW